MNIQVIECPSICIAYLFNFELMLTDNCLHFLNVPSHTLLATADIIVVAVL